jgi:hypothetical protein
MLRRGFREQLKPNRRRKRFSYRERAGLETVSVGGSRSVARGRSIGGGGDGGERERELGNGGKFRK